jgi:hypothetical protein
MSDEFGHSRDCRGVLKQAGFYWRSRSVEARMRGIPMGA